MIVIDGYSIQEYPKQNKIVIALPQTMRTCTNTVEEIKERRDGLSDRELSAILYLTKTYYEMYNPFHLELKEQKE